MDAAPTHPGLGCPGLRGVGLRCRGLLRRGHGGIGASTPSLGWLAAWQEAEAGRFALWLPVCMAAGVLAYFDLRREPPLWWGLAAAPVLLAAVWRLRPCPLLAGLAGACAAFVAGFLAAEVAAWRAPPFDPVPSRAAIVTGSVYGVETLPGGRRITLTDVTLAGAPAPFGRAVRIRLRPRDPTVVASGDRVRVRALLRAPMPPAYPGAWDMQRDAYFSGLTATGAALSPVTIVGAAPRGPLVVIARWREAINARLDALLPPAQAALAQALLTGTQTAIAPPEIQAFRGSGLAHLLSVSGLHIAIVIGIAAVAVRRGLALWPWAALHWPLKPVGLVAGLAAGGFYMVLTGTQVPMVRSFLMAALFVVASLTGRRVLSLRSLALAALLLMALDPVQVVGASMQMSFFAVMALLAGAEVTGAWLRRLGRRGWVGWAAAAGAGAVLTSLLAGGATLPVSAYHFGRVQTWFVLANMAAVPLAGVLVMPAGMLALCLMPLGLEAWPVQVMGWGIEATLWIARSVAALPGATIGVPHLPAWGFGLVCLGLAWIALWQSRLRLAGLALVVVGLGAVAVERPPDLLVSADSRLIGAHIARGSYVQAVQGGSRFTEEAWQHLWNTGPPMHLPHEGRGADGAILCDGSGCTLRPRPDAGAARLVRQADRIGDCGGLVVLVSAGPARGLCAKPWPTLVDRFTVWRDGATAIWLEPEGARIVTDREARGARPWVPPVPQARPPASSLPAAQVDD